MYWRSRSSWPSAASTTTTPPGGPAGELQNRLVQAILRSDLHVIATMRSKTSYAMDEVIEDGRKRTKVVKQGMALIQRDGFEHEFDVETARQRIQEARNGR